MRTLVALVAGLSLVTLTACGSPGVPATRSTAPGTIQWFKAATASSNYSNEWDALSPAFKKRMSRSAGRNIDLGDYIVARQSLQQDPQVRFAESMLKFASIGDARPEGPNKVRVTAGALGQSADIGLVRLRKWELYLVGDNDPYTGIVGDNTIRAEQNGDGSITVFTEGLDSQTFPQSKIRRYNPGLDQWYIDDLGEMEKQFLR